MKGLPWILAGIGVFLGCTQALYSQPLRVNTMPSWSVNHAESNFQYNDSLIIWGTAFGGMPPYTDTIKIDGVWIPNSALFQDPFPVINSDHYLFGHFFSRKFAFSQCGFHTIELKITDAAGVTQSRQSLILIHNDPPFHIKVNMRIERGLLQLFKTCHVYYNNMIFWPRDEMFPTIHDAHTFAGTATAILAFEENAHLYTHDSLEDPYAAMLYKGIRYLFNSAGQVGIYNHDDGTGMKTCDLYTDVSSMPGPCYTGNGMGSYLFNTTYATYANSIGLLAIALSHADSVAAENHLVPCGCFTGWDFKDFLRDALDLIYFYQDDFIHRGGWGYYIQNDADYYDGSLEQWPCLAMAALEARMGMQSPQWIKDNVDTAYCNIIDNNGGCGYASPSMANVGKTGGMLASFSWTGKLVLTGDPQAVAALDYIGSHYGSFGGYGSEDGWAGNFYAMYAMKKGLVLQEVTEVTFNGAPRNWYHDMVGWLTAEQVVSLPSNFLETNQTISNAYGQHPDGGWEDLFFGNTALSTAHAILILTPNVFDLPPAAPTPIYGLCSGDSVQLGSSSGVSVEWFSIPPGFSSALPQPWVHPESDIIYYAFVYDDLGCILEVDSTRVFLWPDTDPQAVYNDPVCFGDTLQLHSQSGWTFSWSGPAGFLSTSQSPEIPVASFSNEGWYYLNMYDTNHCYVADSVMVAVHSLPVTTVSSSSPVCTNDSLLLSAAGGSQYNWSGPGGFYSTQGQPLVTGYQLSMDGMYYVTVSDDLGCASVDSVLVTGLSSPIAAAQSNSPVCQGDTLVLTAQGGTSFFWSGPGGFWSLADQVTFPDAQPSLSGLYQVVVSDNNQCSDTAGVLAEIITAPEITGIITVSPDCHGDAGGSITLQVTGGTSFAYSWNCCPGNDSPVLSGLPAGSYPVTVTNNENCSLTAEIILDQPESFIIDANISPDTCKGMGMGAVSQLSVSGQNPPYSFSWSNGQTTQTIGNLLTGEYTLTLTDSRGCDSTVTFNIGYLSDPEVIVNPDSSMICRGESVLLSAEGSTNYQWMPPYILSSASGPAVSAFPEQTTIVSVIGIDDVHCRDTAQAFIRVIPSPQPDLGPDIWLSLGEQTRLDAPSGYLQYLWSTGESASAIWVADTGLYWLWVSDGTCPGTDSIHVYQVLDIWVPNAFTPDGDGLNDWFLPVCLSCTEIEILVFNRWGEVVFQSDELTGRWDGRMQGEECQDGVYTYLIRYHKPSPQHHDGVGALRGIVFLLR